MLNVSVGSGRLMPPLVAAGPVIEDADGVIKLAVEDSGGSEDEPPRSTQLPEWLDPNPPENTEDGVVTPFELTATEIVFLVDDNDERVLNAWASGFRLCRVV